MHHKEIRREGASEGVRKHRSKLHGSFLSSGCGREVKIAHKAGIIGYKLVLSVIQSVLIHTDYLLSTYSVVACTDLQVT